MEAGGRLGKRSTRKTSRSTRCGSPLRRMSLYLMKVEEECAAGSVKATRASRDYADRMASELVQHVFRLSSRISQYFERPAAARKRTDAVEEVDAGKFVCRLFLKHPTLPQSFRMQFGPQNGLSPGNATCRLNTELNAEEQAITKREWRPCLSDDLFLSPEVIFPWFSQEIVKILTFLKEQDCESDFTDVIFWKLFPGVQLFLPADNKASTAGENRNPVDGGESRIEVRFVPCVKGSGWPGGVRIQHGFPKLKPYVTKGTESLRRLAAMLEDGQQRHSLWSLDPAQTPAVGQPTFWLSRKTGALSRAYSGRPECHLWQLCLGPALRILKDELTSGLRDGDIDRDVDVDKIQSLVAFFKEKHEWTIFNNDVIDSAIMCTVKRHLAETRTTGAMFLKVIDFLGKVAQTRCCPSFLMPNLNILQVSDLDQCEDTAISVKDFLSAIANDETYVLKYLGYRTRSEIEEEGKGQMTKK